ncbi:hypothetical protein L6164_028387 [Bauhinia variegata]|uniref:Uncharacterized protein n=1 Tax=Bauhinia variegata TaxID=167791 RepID=A0ACB9L5Z4_BAUVA|nr:hypothetical protein L6164_028387 [Bauhinia variegata]
MEKSPTNAGCMLYLPLGKCQPSFNLEKAVCNHGFFMMSPNKWIPSTKTLQRPLRLANFTSSVIVSISHPSCDAPLHIYVHGIETLSLEDKNIILKQVTRMLRMSNKDVKTVEEFQKLYPEAKESGFGRLFRSPCLFEDIVKSMLLCYSRWDRTLKMAKSLCSLQFQLSNGSSLSKPNAEDQVSQSPTSKRKRKQKGPVNKNIEEGRNCNDKLIGNFPSSKELASLDEYNLNQHCGLGYRASYIISLAKRIEKGTLNLKKLEEECDFGSYEEVYRKLNNLEGVGPFTSSNILMCLGCYQKIPADTETRRHLQEVHGMSDCKKGTIIKISEEIYKKYAPFQCLAYWFELLNSYEKRFGKLCELNESDYYKITGSIA